MDKGSKVLSGIGKITTSKAKDGEKGTKEKENEP